MKKCFHFGRAIYSNIQSDNGSAIFSWHILWWTSDKVSLFYWHRKGRVGQLQRRAKALLRLAGSTIEYPMGLKDSWSSWVKINYPAHLKLSVCLVVNYHYFTDGIAGALRGQSDFSRTQIWFVADTGLEHTSFRCIMSHLVWGPLILHPCFTLPYLLVLPRSHTGV